MSILNRQKISFAFFAKTLTSLAVKNFNAKVAKKSCPEWLEL